MWAIQLASGFPSADPFLLLRLGANFPGLSWVEPDRLVTANFLHGHWVHIGLNAVGLWFLGTAIEYVLGAKRLIVVYLLSCFAGAAASAAADLGAPSVGASTGIVGLFGALGYVLFRFRKQLPAHLRRATRQWVGLLVLNLLLWFFFRELPIDHAGHAGGFFFGILVTAIITLGWPPLATLQPKFSWIGKVVTAWAVVLVAITVLGLGWTLKRAVTGSDTDWRVVTLILERQAPDAERDNHYAWFVAIAPETDDRTLAVAEQLAERAVSAGGDGAASAAVFDTLATVQFRRGNIDDALVTQNRAVDAENQSELRGQLARFYGEARAASPLAVLDLDASELRAPELRASEEGAEELSPGLYRFVLRREDDVLGLAEAKLEGTGPWTLHQAPTWAEGAEAEYVAFISLREAGSGPGLKWWEVSDEVRRRPGPLGRE